MPRVSTMKTDDEEAVAAPRKRAPRKRVSTASNDEVVTKRVRKTPARVEVADDEPVRRAPTPLHSERQAARRNTNGLLLGGIGLVCGLGLSIGIGYTDKGQIDVVAVVNDRNEKINRGEIRGDNGETITKTIPVQNADARPNGGLVPIEVANTPAPDAPAVPAESDTASSTSATSTAATSTSETAPASTTPIATS